MFGFAVATGRSIVEARRLFREWSLPSPLAYITSVGSEIYVEQDGVLAVDKSFWNHIAHGWDPDAIDQVMSRVAGLTPQPCYEQRAYKRSYFVSDHRAAFEIEAVLNSEGITARVVFSHGRLLDILPPKAGKAAAMKHVAASLGIEAQNVFAAGDSGNDADMLAVCRNAILVRNHAEEVIGLADRPNVYLSKRSNASGALEGLLAHQRAQRARARRTMEISA